MSITIGSLVLDEEQYAPTSNISFEYYTSDSGEIIGGNIIAKITGIVSVSDQDGSKTGSVVMSRLALIRKLGSSPKCVVTTGIPNFNPLGDKARITNVTIDQGPDPSWVNQGAYSIELRGLISSIPSNSFGITAADGVVELSRKESITIGEDSHGYVYDEVNGVSKAFIRFSNSISLKCETYCGSTNTTISVLKRLVKYGISNSKLITLYGAYKKYLQSRSIEIDNDGSISFSCDMILLPPTSTGTALVDLIFSYNRTYESKDITYVTSGTVTGLVNIDWGDLVTLVSTCSVSKLANAMGTFTKVRGKYEDLNSWAGQTLELNEKPNCPPTSNTNIGRCENKPEDGGNEDSNYIKPSSGTISVSRTDGVINFNFEWSTTQDSSGGTCIKDGIKTETTVEIIEPQPQYVEHILPGRGTLIQNLNCKSAKKVNITVATSYPEDNCGNKTKCTTNDGLAIAINQYVPAKALLIENTTTETRNSYTIRQNFIECL